jgi:chorismate mutase
MSGAGADSDWSAELEALRTQIEAVDDRLIALLQERVRLARQVGVAKRAAGLPTLDPRREAAVVRRAGEQARAAGLQDEDVRYIFWHVIGLSRRAQMEES